MVRPTITIEVDEKTAQTLAQASLEERQKVEALLRLRLRELASEDAASLTETMDAMAQRAAERGLTADELDAMLRG